MFDRPNNAFLASLDDKSFALLSGRLSRVDLARGQRLQRNEAEVEYVYFPETCLLSMTTTDCSARSVETSMVGNEGAAGLIEACNSGISTVDSNVQIGDHALRLSVAACRQLASSDPGFSAKAWRVAELQLIETRQSGLCQAMHSVEHRLARWLVECFDRTGRRNPLTLTQEALSLMLGVQRTTVSSFAFALQEQGLIRYSRGALTIRNVEGLEHLACDCRKLAKAQRKRLGLANILVAEAEELLLQRAS